MQGIRTHICMDFWILVVPASLHIGGFGYVVGLHTGLVAMGFE